MAQQLKDPALSLLWHEFNPWPGNFHVPWVVDKKKNIYIYIYIRSIVFPLRVASKYVLRQYSFSIQKPFSGPVEKAHYQLRHEVPIYISLLSSYP